MSLYRWIGGVFRSLFRKAELDGELDEELRSYLDMLVEEKVRAGMSPAEAERRARIELGGEEQVREDVRERRLGAALDALLQDVRYALRSLRKNAGITAVSALILAVGIGANTALFSTVHFVLVRSLPFPHPDRLVVGLKTMNGEMSGPVSRVDYFDYRERSRSFERLAALTTFVEQHTVTGGGDPELVEASYVTWNLFPTLGVVPVRGRSFLPEEEVRGGASSVIISYGYWQRRFGGADDAVGATLTLDGTPSTVVGVMPRGFRFMFDADVWQLIDRNGPFDTQRDSHSHWVAGRLAPGVSIDQAQADVDGISRALAEEYPESNTGKALALADLHGYLVRNVRTSLLLLMGTTVLVLLIACANVAGLLLARGERRRSEMAMRVALGAPRHRLLRQLLTESVLLAVGAAILGIMVAFLLKDLLLRLLPAGELGPRPPGVNTAVLAFTLLLSVATGLLVGIVPAFRSTTVQPGRRLKAESRTTPDVRSSRFRSGLVVLQVALSVTLLVGSGLLIRSLARLSTVQLGFDPENILTGQVQIQVPDYPTPVQRDRFYASLLEEVEALPGVQRAALANKLPILSRWQDWSVWPVGEPPPLPNQGLSAMARWVTPGYFRTLGIPVLAGRDIAGTDVLGSPYVVVVSRSVAETLFPSGDPVGQQVRIGDWRDFEIVGVVEDARLNTLRREPDAAMYMSAAQMAPARMQIAVRTSGNPDLLVRPIEALLRQKDPNVLFARPRPMADVVGEELAGFRAIMLALVLFACIAVCLAAFGFYGVLAYYVSQRKGELGVRLAMGASEADLVRMILKRGLVLVGLGLGLGLAAAYPGTLVVGQLLFETRLLDPLSYVTASAALGLVAVLACYLPARRAARSDVVDVLRAE
ncbi:MAG: ABC transporter permease [Gemmatimonadota bacterium]